MQALRPRRTGALMHELEATGESVLFVEEQRQLLVVNPLGAAIWYLVDGKRTVDEIADVITEHLEAPRDQVLTDVTAFLRQLESRAIVELDVVS